MALYTDVRLENLCLEQVDELLEMFHEMALEIRLPNKVTATIEDIKLNLLGPNAVGHAFMLTLDKCIIGYVTSSIGVSSSAAKPVLFVDDIFVRPGWRNQGVGKQVMKRLIELGRTINCHSIEWMVLKDNVSAIAFYRELGCEMSARYYSCSITLSD